MSSTPPPSLTHSAHPTQSADTDPDTSQASATARKSALAALRGLLPFLAPYKKQFLLAGLALLVAAAATLAVPYAFKQMIDLGFGAAGPGAAGSGATGSQPHSVQRGP